MADYICVNETPGLEGAWGYVRVSADGADAAWAEAERARPGDRILMVVGVEDAHRVHLNRGWTVKDWMDSVARAEKESPAGPRHPEESMVRVSALAATGGDVVALGGRLLVVGDHPDLWEHLLPEAAAEAALRARDPLPGTTGPECVNNYFEFLCDRPDPDDVFRGYRLLKGLTGFDFGFDLSACPAFGELIGRWGEIVDPDLWETHPELFGPEGD